MRRHGALIAGLTCAVLGFAWQALTVHYNYGGNWTALFCHGSDHPLPKSLAWEHIYVFPNSGGYDGQSYHYVAHDPLCRTDICRAVPDPALRYPRILVPALVQMFALGRQEWIDASFFVVNLGFLFLGAYWLAQLCPHPMWAVLYVLTPASVASLDRMLMDLAATTLCLGFAVYLKSGSTWKLWGIIAAAAVCREAGFVLFAGYAVYLLAKRQYGRTALFATALIPSLCWLWWVRTNVPGATGGLPTPMPLWGIISAEVYPRHYEYAAVFIRSLEVLQLAGLVLGMALALREGRRAISDPIKAACFLWAFMGLMMHQGFYDDPYAGARVFTPMMLFQFLSGERWSGVPLLAASPRVWLQLGLQVLGILRGIF
jgi:hypothetical protein